MLPLKKEDLDDPSLFTNGPSTPVTGTEDGEGKEVLDQSGGVNLTALQLLISRCIIEKGGACDFETIHQYVSHNRDQLRGRDGQPKSTDCRRAILASLSKNTRTQPLFQVKHSSLTQRFVFLCRPLLSLLLNLSSLLVNLSYDCNFASTQKVEGRSSWWQLGECNSMYNKDLSFEVEKKFPVSTKP